MGSNLLKVLREALPGQPTLRDVAKAVGCSFGHVNKFESGVYRLNDEQFARYAKYVGVPVKELRLRFHQVALDRAMREASDHRQELKKLGVANVYRKRAWRDAG